MSKLAFHRPARTFPPSVPEQHVALPSPPQKAVENQASNWLYLLLPLLSSVSMAAYMVTFGRPWMIMLGIGFVVTSVGVTVFVRMQTGKTARVARLRQRDRYVEFLTDIRAQARASADAQRAVNAFLHPSPRRLWAIATGRRRVWERRPADEDFLKLRLGQGTGTPAMNLSSGKRGDPTAEFEVQSQRAADRLVRDFARVSHEPAWVDLANTGVLSLNGPRERTAPLVGALLLQLGVLHAPDDVQVVALVHDDAPWTWVKWLPHAWQSDPRSAMPVVSQDVEGISDVLEAHLERVRGERAEAATNILRRETKAERHLVVVLDGFRPDAEWTGAQVISDLLAEAGPASGLHVVCTVTKESEEPGRVDARARVGADGALALESRTPALISPVADATADGCPPGLGEQAARALTPLRLAGEREQVLSRTVLLPDMLGLGALEEVDPPSLWRAPDDESLLQLPIGVTGDGEQLVLDLKESALGGVGPHGLVVGATGSGKSELLRTLVTGLTLTHSPEQLSFVLVDFKGGATFAGVTELPHVAGLITNLSDDLALVDRVRAALQGEQTRRQQMLRDAGNVDSVREYQILQAQGATGGDGQPLQPMPYLMIMVDEFGELLAQRPDFIELFVQIGRVGRSLGMHLLLATQRLDEGRLRGLESHLSYRICLRTFSAAESRAVIGTTDAYRLPSIPGSAYLKVDESVYERFRVAHVSGAHRGSAEEPVERRVEVSLVPFGLRTKEHALSEEPEPAEAPAAPVPLPEAGRRTEMQVAVERMMMHGNPVHQVWLPPLPPAVELDSLLGPVATDATRGFRSEVWPGGGRLTIPIGVIDLPARQEQRALLLDLSGGHGHVAVVGAPQSGKSTLLRTTVVSAMLTHTPDELQFICVDFGGGSLSGVEGAPHVSGVATRHDEAKVLRALSVVRQRVEEREQLFRQLKIDTPDDFRRLRDEGALPEGTNAADLVLVIDNWSALRSAVEVSDEILLEVATRGLGVGIHLLMSTNRWSEIRSNLRDNITGRLELRLNEPGESEISRNVARGLRAVLPGRGIVAPGNVFHAALPRIDGVASSEGLTKAQHLLVNDLRMGWTGKDADPLQVLSTHITPADLEFACAQAHPEGAGLHAADVPVGIREFDLAPAVLNLETDGPHFVVFGDSGSGKTSFLRSWMRGMTRRRSPWDIRFIVIDYRRGLLETVPEDYVGAQAGESQAATVYVEQLAEKLQERIPPPGISARELRQRSWWTGPELYLVVDDYDLVAGGAASGGPLGPLGDYLTQASDIGFHLVLGRRIGGVARSAMSDPLVGRMRELGTGGLILSGDPREGALLGDQRAARRPPGRGALVSRKGGASVIQTVHEPADPEQAP
ncbi:type VII secretion protein EccCa [Streptomyces anthocyanicus]|uniref:type VII secretion protein EccCa n=1 Tax=Streptomyces anthocyanicus TaxID=68174 RepID=UPI002F91B374|nr:type VII secretion protein EccCa [Streptomyces anthocyanicus]